MEQPVNISNTTVETERLLLKQMTDEDYVHILSHGSDAEVMELMNLQSADQVMKERKKADKGFATFNKSLLVFLLTDKTSEKQIGWCGFHTWYCDHNRAEIGYVIYKDEWKGKGLMKEAMRAVLDFGFNSMHLKRIEAFISPENIPSLKLVQHFGFTMEGLLRNHYCKNGKPENSAVYGLLADEWRTSK
jgi:ribosomal-protein-alanine N-acetyltransferase